jgi:hypothetical protein
VEQTSAMSTAMALSKPPSWRCRGADVPFQRSLTLMTAVLGESDALGDHGGDVPLTQAEPRAS